MLACGYAERQRERIDSKRAFGRMPAPGEPDGVAARLATSGSACARSPRVAAAPDTIYAYVIDRHGNAYSATPSDTTFDAPVVPGTGLVISTRGQQSRLDAAHPASVAPGRRPRLTPCPALVLQDGKPVLCLGTPGGDVQPQAMRQVLLNITQFGMQLQQAVEAPRFSTHSFPNSSAPHDYLPERLCLEEDIGEDVIDAMRERGHDVQILPRLPAQSGAVCADPRTGPRARSRGSVPRGVRPCLVGK